MLRPDFVISDTHFGHQKIMDYQDRPFDHEAMMIKRWRATVNPNHTVLHLGDLFFSGNGGLNHFYDDIAPHLTGRKFIILGNHDRRSIDFEELGFTVLKPYQIQYRGWDVSFDHYPKLIHDNQKRIHLHGHIHANPYANGEMTRANNINVSVEVVNYQPQRFCKLINQAIYQRNGHDRYCNNRHQRRKRSSVR